MISAALVTAELLRLSCSLQAASEDGSVNVGPIFVTTFVGPTYLWLEQNPDLKDQPTSTLEGGDALRLARTWRSARNWHGSMVLEPSEEPKHVSGMLVPVKKGNFDIYWVDETRLRPDGAPITIARGRCTPVVGDIQ